MVDLVPDRVVAERPRSNRVIQAFSCGVDATFTLLSNKYLNRERGGYDITTGLLVHGFDVGYDNTSDFVKLADRARRVLEHAGVELKLVRTNSRTLNLQSWQNSNTAQLAACLHQFSGHYGRALLGSAEPYYGHRSASARTRSPIIYYRVISWPSSTTEPVTRERRRSRRSDDFHSLPNISRCVGKAVTSTRTAACAKSASGRAVFSRLPATTRRAVFRDALRRRCCASCTARHRFTSSS